MTVSTIARSRGLAPDVLSTDLLEPSLHWGGLVSLFETTVARTVPHRATSRVFQDIAAIMTMQD